MTEVARLPQLIYAKLTGYKLRNARFARKAPQSRDQIDLFSGTEKEIHAPVIE